MSPHTCNAVHYQQNSSYLHHSCGSGVYHGRCCHWDSGRPLGLLQVLVVIACTRGTADKSGRVMVDACHLAAFVTRFPPTSYHITSHHITSRHTHPVEACHTLSKLSQAISPGPTKWDSLDPTISDCATLRESRYRHGYVMRCTTFALKPTINVSPEGRRRQSELDPGVAVHMTHGQNSLYKPYPVAVHP